MKIRFESPALPKSGIFITFVAEGGKLSGLAAKADAAADGHVSRAMKAAKFEGKRDQMLDILAPAGTHFERIAVFGIGDPAKLTAREVEYLGGTIAGALQGMKAKETTIAADLPAGVKLKAGQAPALLASGVRLRTYGFLKYKTKKAEENSGVSSLTVLTSDAAAAKQFFADLDAVAAGVHMAR
ncbi:MAG: leucyl aminopeptidase, partial [Rhizobiales bacterium]|nr:leucyl aminopeptidase [Hyphomicrobiales bacterium]